MVSVTDDANFLVLASVLYVTEGICEELHQRVIQQKFIIKRWAVGTCGIGHVISVLP